MLDTFQKFLADLAGKIDGDAQTRDLDAHPARTASAALMYHVIQADGILRDVEQERFAAVLEEEYNLTQAELKKLIDAARSADSEAVDLYRFTSVLMDTMSETERVSFIEILWEMVYADGYKHELEDNIVWRISELLGVSGRDRVLMRQRVQERHGITNTASRDS